MYEAHKNIYIYVRNLVLACFLLGRYGCGSCGPRGFYGTIDLHLNLEEKLARFVGSEAAIIYSYDMATAASVIPAFAKKGDLLVVDEACQFSIMVGGMCKHSNRQGTG